MTDEKPPAISLPESFETRMRGLYGREGSRWLKTLSGLRMSLHKHWSLKDPEAVSQFTYNYLEFAHSQDFGPVVLKIGFPNPELITEIKTLKIYQMRAGAVRLLDWDLEKGALLLERILPGRDLTSLSDYRKATQIAGRAMINLHTPAPQGNDFPTMEKWCQGFARYQQHHIHRTGPLPNRLCADASDLAGDLLSSGEKRYLLHGDLHHGNLLLKGPDTWVVIDPKGVIGEFACEIGPYLCNPVPSLIQRPELAKIMGNRLHILGEITGLDKKRMAAWSFCRAVLAAIWSVEEGENQANYWIAIAEIIRKMV